MSAYFGGKAGDLGQVHQRLETTFDALAQAISRPVQLPMTRAAYHKLTKEAQGQAKRVDYLVPCTFGQTPAKRRTQGAQPCNLLALDIDDATTARRLLTQRFEDLLGSFAFVVWHTASSTRSAPRLRVLVAADRISPKQYPSAVRSLATLLDIMEPTRESLVPVQPMYLPTAFQGEEDSPIVALRPLGDAFLSVDIDSEEDLTAPEGQGEDKVGDDRVVDIEYLRSPMEEVGPADVAEALKHLDPDLPMQQWIEVAAGIKHQFDSDAGFALWHKWSAKGKKYTNEEDLRYRWDSLRANPEGRAPVTIRSVFRRAQAAGWSNPTLTQRAFLSTMHWIDSPQRSTEELLDQGLRKIAKVSPTLGAIEKRGLLNKMRTVLGNRGVVVPVSDIKSELRALEGEASKGAGVLTWSRGLCFVTAINKFYRHSTERQFTPEVLDLVYAVPGSGDGRPMRAREYAVQVAGIPQVENLRYEPAQGGKRVFVESDVPYVNTYRATFAQPDKPNADKAGALFMAHLEHLIAEDNYRRTLVDFLAYHVQHPGRKIRWAVLLQGAQGCGKTFLAVAMSVVLGRRNVRKLSASDVLEGNHNGWAYGQQLVVMEEVRIVGHNRYGVMDKLKPCISDDEISLRELYQPHRTVPNITNYLMFTNHHDSLAIHDDDRRYFVLSSPLQNRKQVEALGGEDYFGPLFGMLATNGGGLRAWFEAWTISPQFNPEGRAPRTTYLAALAEAAATPLNAAVAQVIEDQPHALVRHDLLSQRSLRACIDAGRLPAFTEQALASVLRELGWRKAERIDLEGEKHQLWTRDWSGRDAERVARERFENL